MSLKILIVIFTVFCFIGCGIEQIKIDKTKRYAKPGEGYKISVSKDEIFKPRSGG